MFERPKVVANWSIIGGLINIVACARCFFIHERLIGVWLGLVALAMVAQFHMANEDAERDGD